MPSTASDFVKAIKINTRRSLEVELDCAVDEAIQHALTSPGYGVLVTRHSPGDFTVELSSNVGPGVIEEVDLFVPL